MGRERADNNGCLFEQMDDIYKWVTCSNARGV